RGTPSPPPAPTIGRRRAPQPLHRPFRDEDTCSGPVAICWYTNKTAGNRQAGQPAWPSEKMASEASAARSEILFHASLLGIFLHCCKKLLQDRRIFPVLQGKEFDIGAAQPFMLDSNDADPALIALRQQAAERHDGKAAAAPHIFLQ